MQVHETHLPHHVAGPRRPARPQEPAPGRDDTDAITPGEREYFARLFPGSATEIRAHAVYARNGAAPQVRTGGILDRKG